MTGSLSGIRKPIASQNLAVASFWALFSHWFQARFK